MKTAKKYTEPTKHQLGSERYVFQKAREACSENQTVVTRSREIWDFNGVLYFILSIEAKNRTSMLFIVDKAYTIKIGRRGAIRSQRISYSKKEKDGKKQKGFSPYQ